jgi:hypothetical protein
MEKYNVLDETKVLAVLQEEGAAAVRAHGFLCAYRGLCKTTADFCGIAGLNCGMEQFPVRFKLPSFDQIGDIWKNLQDVNCFK